MLNTREEIALLLERAEGNLQKIEAIHRELQSLMDYIEDILSRKAQSAKRASGRRPTTTNSVSARSASPFSTVQRPRELLRCYQRFFDLTEQVVHCRAVLTLHDVPQVAALGAQKDVGSWRKEERVHVLNIER